MGKKRLYNIQMPIVGLTGGIASGKSTASHYLSSRGYFVIDADDLVKTIYKREDIIGSVTALVPEVIENQKINFKLLREKVFASSDLKLKIENLVYSKLQETFLKSFSKFNPDKYNSDFIIYDAPLIFEKELYLKLDMTVLITCSKKTQIARLMRRDKINQDLAESMIASQMPLEEKEKLADKVVINESSESEFRDSLETVFQDIKLQH